MWGISLRGRRLRTVHDIFPYAVRAHIYYETWYHTQVSFSRVNGTPHQMLGKLMLKTEREGRVLDHKPLSMQLGLQFDRIVAAIAL